MRTPATKRLILTTALTLPMTAVGAGMALAQADNACAELEAFLEQDMPEGIPQTEEELARIIEAGDPEQCQVANVEIERAVQSAQQNQQTGAQEQEREQAQSDQQQTEEELAETESTRVQLSDEVVVEGEVFVEQQPPEVDVEAGQTEVVVRDSQPEVTIGGEAPQILVREAAPRIRVDVPQPTITIERQPPEIIVTMPPANVDVANARPQIEVRQGEPKVTVRQTNPTIDLQLSQAENPEEAQGIRVRNRQSGEEMAQGETTELTDVQANVAQAEPVVTYEESSDQQQAVVQDQRGQPNVQYEAADPQVEVNTSGEPQIEVTQAGEPKVTFREAGETEQAAAGTEQQQGDDQRQQMAAAEQSEQQTGGQLQAEDVERTAEAQQPQEGQEQEGAQVAQTETADQPPQNAGEEATDLSDAELGTSMQEGGGTQQEVAQAEAQQDTRPNIQREGYEMTEASQVQVDQLTGTNVYGVNDENIGEIGDIVMNSAGEVEHVIVDVGGFLGLGQKPVAVDFGEVTVLRQQGGEELRAYVDATQEELENMEPYRE